MYLCFCLLVPHFLLGGWLAGALRTGFHLSAQPSTSPRVVLYVQINIIIIITSCTAEDRTRPTRRRRQRLTDGRGHALQHFKGYPSSHGQSKHPILGISHKIPDVHF